MPRPNEAALHQTAKLIPPEDIDSAWPGLSVGFQAVKAKAGLDDLNLIRQRLIARQAFLFVAPNGFFILLPIHTTCPAVLVWVAYGLGGGQIKKYVPIIEALALEIGAEQIEIESPRRGYQRIFHDWQKLGDRYIRRLS